ncbi:MAG: DegT/DnrJ/EryC1/StrS family aminotransferase [Acidobacteria bacterium]|nr:DegT/DnrJ/EryC1/StrS family aminotransferase [Acidobacteriota bacterium]MBI3656355.1 DegT/DnrJ/EryC1/StrS family aminotransferase [Acidobacteriota bacterium]
MGRRLALHGGQKVVPDELKVRWPVVTQTDKDAVMEVLDSGILWAMSAEDGSLLAPQMLALESEFARYLDVKHALAVNGGTSALHMAVAAAGVGPGDEVITTAFSFVATAAAILHHNAIPIFVDIDPRTYNIDVSRIEEKITPRTKAIIPVHIHGLPADMDEIWALARKYELAVIEDACQAPGAYYKGRRTGSLGHMAAFSLNGTKNFGIGEGGLFTTNDDDFRDRANMFRQVGESLPSNDGGSRYQHLLAWNYRAQETQCALARSLLRRLDEVNGLGQRNAAYLTKHLADLPGITPPYIPSDRTSVFHKYRVRLEPEALGIKILPIKFREAVRTALLAEGVDVVLWQTSSMPALPMFQTMAGYGQGYPWTNGASSQKYVYRIEDYPETNRLLDCSLVIGSEFHPVYCQSPKLMECYVEAIAKVFSSLEAIVDGAERYTTAY